MCQLCYVPEVPTAKCFTCSIEVLTTFYLGIYLNFVYLHNFVLNTLYR